MYTKSMLVAALMCLLCATQPVFAQVSANFSADVTAACSPVVVRFTDQSTGNITSWHWSFGNGNVSTQRNPGAVYLQPGFKTVSLIVSDGVDSDTLVMPNFIQVYQDPEADLSAVRNTGCTPFSVCFNDFSLPGSGAITSWIWDFGDGNSSTAQNPCNTYSTPGTYNVTLLVKDVNGCESQITYPSYIIASDTLKAAFSAPVNSACNPPLNVNFVNNSTSSGPLSYVWSFGNGVGSSIANPSHNYTQAGVYDVKLVISNAFGCKDSIFKPGFVAIEPLYADFAADTTQGCVGNAIQFTDLSTSNPNTWLWTFGDGTTSTDQNPLHVYNAPGVYSVKMVAANSGSCADSIQKVSYITISPSPIASFTGDNLSGCQVPHTVQFTDASTGALAWFWDFGDGTTSTLQNPTHTYTDDSVYTVSLMVASNIGCTNSLVMPGYISITPPQANLTADPVRGCLPLSVDFSDSSTATGNIVSWFWDFGDGATSTDANPTHIYTTPGIFDISLVITNDLGCTDTVVRSNYVRAGNRPNANLSPSVTDMCIYGSVTFTDLSLGDVNQWLWQFGDGQTSIDENPTYAYSDTGIFTVTLIAISNGCADTLVMNDLIHVSPPDARFLYSYDCESPYTVTFTDNSLAPDNWFWSFGDGTTSTDRDPVHVFPARGIYTVSLTVEDTLSGCYDIEALEVNITDPVADFFADATVGCHPFKVTFTDTSIDALGYQWLSAGMTRTAENPTFTYTVPGIYDVTLVITDAHGCKDTLVRPDYITVLGPLADFDATPVTGCAPLGVQFSDSSVAFNSPIISYNWQFGDGDSATTASPYHTYQQTGTYDVALTVTDGNGCAHTLLKNDFISPTYPKPSFSADTQSCTTAPIIFSNMSNGQGLSYVWHFGDGDTSTQTAPTHLYDAVGTYTVSLVVTDQNGCDSTLVKPDYITISEPKANFFADSNFSPCPPLLVSFFDSSTADIIAWQWDFGDGGTSNLQNPSHVYLAPGSYTVSLVTTTAKGCTDTLLKADYVVVMGPTGSFTFTPRNGCMGNEVQFNAVTQNTAAHTWDFGDGTLESSDDTTTHIYGATGVHYPVLILDDGLGCVYALPANDSVVIGQLEVNFAANNTFLCDSGSVAFHDSTISFPAANYYQWLFGDGDSANVQNPTHTYNQNGAFDVTLIVGNGYCYDTFTRPQYIVVEQPAADFTISQQAGCLPHQVILEDASVTDSTVVGWAWDFGNGLTDSVQNTAVTYNDTGRYDIQLVITSATGCTDTMVKTIEVYPLPVVTVTADTSICFTDSIQLVAQGASTYQWNTAFGLSSDTIGNPFASPANTTQYVVTGTDTNGCVSFDSVLVTVNALPVADAGPDREICLGQTAELNGSGGISYLWSPAATLSCDECSTTVAQPVVTTNYVLQVSNVDKCVDTDTVQVVVRPLPQGIVSADTTICAGNSVQLEAAGGTNYYWVPATGLSCTTCADPVATPDSTITYELSVTNQYGCSITDLVTITVNPNPVAAITGTDVICAGEVSRLEATGGVAYQWSPATALSCTGCPNPDATPGADITYSVVVTNVFGCTVEESYSIAVKPMPVAETIADDTICNGDQIVLESTQTHGYRYIWSPADGLSNERVLSPIARPERTTTYTLTVESEYGCATTASVTITVIEHAEVSVDEELEMCYGGQVQPQTLVLQEGHLGTTLLWTPVNEVDDITALSPVLKPEVTTTYQLIAYSGACIPDTHQVNVTVHQLPVLTPKENEPVVEQTTVDLVVDAPDNIVSYSWSPANELSCADCANPSLLATRSETYQLTVVDEFGCENTTRVPVQVVGACGDDLFVPNLFTPNRDGNNDKLFVRGRGVVGLQYFRIFDRWGNMVFETRDISEGWNGVYKGRAVDAGVFVYQFEAICSNGYTVTRGGNVTLMK